MEVPTALFSTKTQCLEKNSGEQAENYKASQHCGTF